MLFCMGVKLGLSH